MKKQYLKRIFLFLVSSLLLGCEPSSAHKHAVCVTLGNTHLVIPSRYFLPMFPPTLVPRQGLDKDVGELLEIPLTDLGYEMETEKDYDPDLTFLITPINMHNPPSRLPPSVAQAWNGYGYYKDRIIEFDGTSQLYRIYSTKYKILWNFFKLYPDKSNNYIKNWVAGCIKIRGEFPTLLNSSCKTTYLYKDIHIEITFSGERIKLVDEFENRIRNLFQELEVESCPSRFMIIE